jgi:trimeric autotransporter adhesin
MNLRQGLAGCGRAAWAIFLALSLGSCSGFFPSSTTITALSISPTSAYITPQSTEQYSATATYGNNSTGDVTSSVTWTSSQTGVATINSSGLATGVAVGSTTITATSSNNVSSNTTLTVSTKTVTALTISPTNPSISLSQDQMQQFTATATFSDGSLGNVTSQAGWTSSVPSVAAITSSGLASPVGVGSTTIGASYGGQAATTTLTVTQ